MSLFSQVQPVPPIEVFELNAAYMKDQDPNKVNLGIGAFRTEEGKPWVLPVVKKAEKLIADDDTLNHEYFPIVGWDVFSDAATQLVLGNESKALAEGRVLGVQCLSGTGSLRIALEFLTSVMKFSIAYVSEPTWENHNLMCKKTGYAECRKYRYWNAAKKGIDFDGMLEDLRQAPENAVIILHGAAHNPTGVDPTQQQWQQIAQVMREKKLFTLFDIAYQGFASGDLDRGAYPVRLWDSLGMESFTAQSFAKTFGYNERIGNLVVVLNNKNAKDAVRSQIAIISGNAGVDDGPSTWSSTRIADLRGGGKRGERPSNKPPVTKSALEPSHSGKTAEDFIDVSDDDEEDAASSSATTLQKMSTQHIDKTSNSRRRRMKAESDRERDAENSKVDEKLPQQTKGVERPQRQAKLKAIDALKHNAASSTRRHASTDSDSDKVARNKLMGSPEIITRMQKTKLEENMQLKDMVVQLKAQNAQLREKLAEKTRSADATATVSADMGVHLARQPSVRLATAALSQIPAVVPPHQRRLEEDVPKTRPTIPVAVRDSDKTVAEVVAAPPHQTVQQQPAANKQMVFMFTGFKEQEKPVIINTLIAVLDVQTLDLRTTHLLCKHGACEEIVFSCIGHGAMLLHPSYVMACQRAQQLISDPAVVEEQYEWGGEVQLRGLRQAAARESTADRKVFMQTISLVESAKQWRQIVQKTGRKPMSEIVFAVELSDSKASKYTAIIKAAGGKIVPLFDTDKSGLPRSMHKELTIVLVDGSTVESPKLVGRYDALLRAGVHVFSREFVKDFLATPYPPPPPTTTADDDAAVFPFNMTSSLMDYPAVKAKYALYDAIGSRVCMKPIWRRLLNGSLIDLTRVSQQQQQQTVPLPLLATNGSANNEMASTASRKRRLDGERAGAEADRKKRGGCFGCL